MSRYRLRQLVVGAALAAIAAPIHAGTVAAQETAVQASSSPGGVLFHGSVPGEIVGTGQAVNFVVYGAAPGAPVVATGTPGPGDADLGRPWAFFAALDRVSANPVCTSFENPRPFELSDAGGTPLGPELGVEGPDPKIGFDMTCGGEPYRVSLEGRGVGPFTNPSYSKGMGYRIGMPVFYVAYLQRRWGPAKVRVCRTGGERECFERAPGTHPGGSIVGASNWFNVVQRRTATAGGTV